MKHRLQLVLIVAIWIALASVSRSDGGQPEPLWAYGFLTPPGTGTAAVSPDQPKSGPQPVPEPTAPPTLLRVEGSSAAYTRAYIRDGRNPIDWFPGEHPPMPEVVAHGPSRLGSAARGCALCHLPTGKGRPENAPVVGQPAAYLIRQLGDFRRGDRHSADPRKPNTLVMIALAQGMTESEIQAAAAYFAAMKWTPWTRVVETDLVPKTRIEGNLFLATAAARTEPIDGRIIEVPENEAQSEVRRNPRSGFVAYVPVGSLQRGENLVRTGGARIDSGKIVPGKTIACAVCHGAELLGLADVPGIAGRSPSYLVRQLYDLQQGTRRGTSAPLMQPVVAHLTGADMTAIAAYVTSLAGIRP